MRHGSNGVFANEARFNYATFQGESEFAGTLFRGTATFSHVAIRALTRFMGRPERQVFSGKADFSSMRERVELLAFEDADLSRATFLGTNIENVSFRLIRWYSPPSARNRKALWDEFNPATDEMPEYDRILENYRQLVLNYERRRDYGTADSFHIGEMEIYRRQTGAGRPAWQARILRCLTLVNLYKISSYYGTSYRRARSPRRNRPWRPTFYS